MTAPAGKILVTGAAGFIGAHVCQALAQLGHQVVGIDNVNDYYSPRLKLERVKHFLDGRSSTSFRVRATEEITPEWLAGNGVAAVIHLAAMAGVRYSTERPMVYIEQNIGATTKLLDACRLAGVRRFVYASSSSAKNVTSVYGATKRAVDAIAEAYAKLHGMACLGLRYHTVYGPWGRPDMMLWKFTARVLAGEPVELYNRGEMSRDFTFIEDAVAATIMALDYAMGAGQGHNVVDIGSGRSRTLGEVVEILGDALGLEVRAELLPMQQGDVTESLADNGPAGDLLGYEPTTGIEEGMPAFVAWYRDHHRESAGPGEAPAP